MRVLVPAVLGCLFWASTASAFHTAKHELLKESVQVLEEMRQSPDQGIPFQLIQKAKAIIIIPTLLKGGFLLGARYGEGVATVRNPYTGQWSPPAFITTAGASFGFQAGAQAIDLVLLVMTERGLKGLLKDQFTLGGDIALSAGPVGRYAEAGTDLLFQGEIYSYSRSKGIFGGVSLKGTVIQANREKNRSYYGKAYEPARILLGGPPKILPPSARAFMEAMNKLAPPPPHPQIQRTGLEPVPVEKRPKQSPPPKPKPLPPAKPAHQKLPLW